MQPQDLFQPRSAGHSPNAPLPAKPEAQPATGAHAAPPRSRPENPDAAPSRITVSPRTAVIVSACLVALTANSLGATWLGSRVLFLPIGLWLVGAVVLIYELGLQRLQRAALNFLDSADLLLGRVLSRVDEESSTRLGRLGARVGDVCAVAVTPVIKPRIAVDLPSSDAETILAAAHDLARAEEPLWVRLGGRDRARFSPSQIALLRRAPGEGADFELLVPERAGRKCVWWDWSQPLPLGYAAVFPPRLDPGHIRITGIDLHDAGQVRLLVLLAQAAAAHALGATRGFAERLRSSAGGGGVGGNGGLGAAVGGSVAPALPAAFDPEVATLRLAREFERQSDAARRTPLAAAAARIISAFCVDPDYTIEEAERTRLLELCSRTLPDEPEIALRLATGQFASYADERGLHTLLNAYDRLRNRQGCFTDPLAFVFSEIETGRESPLTVGRVAAGYALVWATAPDDRLPFLRADLSDELRYAAWLVGRDQDHRLLLQVIHELDRAQASQGTLWARDPEARAGGTPAAPEPAEPGHLFTRSRDARAA